MSMNKQKESLINSSYAAGISQFISFKGNNSAKNTEYKELTDIEFENMKKEVMRKYHHLPNDLKSRLDLPELNEFNIFVANKIVSGRAKYSAVYSYADGIICEIESPEKAQVAGKLTDLILSSDNSHNVLASANRIIYHTNTPEQAELKCNLVDKILSDPNLYESKTVMEYAPEIIHSTDTPEQAQVADKFLSEKRFYSVPDVLGEAGDIIADTLTIDEARETIAYLNKILVGK